MMSWIFTICAAASAVTALLTGQASAVSSAALAGASAGVQLVISIAGPLCLWCAIAGVMERAGLMQLLARAMRPLLGRLYPESSRNPEILGPIAANFSANLLGLGNAATPLGMEAVCRMRQMHPGTQASDEMCRLIVMNTASVQLIPATVAAVRASLGCHAPFDILPAVWVTSLCSVTAGLLAARFLQRFFR